MKPAEYFEAAKARLNLQSDYALCKRFDIPNASMPAMKNGTRAVPLDVAYKLAITLEIDPAQVVADLEEQREKSPQRKAFWTGFIQRAAMLIVTAACTLVLSFSVTYESAGALFGGNRRRLNRA
jgi:hypothetical protein